MSGTCQLPVEPVSINYKRNKLSAIIDVLEWFNYTVIPSNQSKKLFRQFCVIGSHIMGIYLHHVLATIYVFVTMACSEHIVKSDQLEKQRIRECHGKSEDCSAGRQKGGKHNDLLRLPRITGVKVNTSINTYTRKWREADLETMAWLAYTEVSNMSKLQFLFCCLLLWVLQIA